jgi:cytoskeletal protein RodZ
MALSQDEQRMLAEIERRLAADDPGLASCLTTFRRPGPGTVLRSPRARILGSLFTVLLVAMVSLMVYAMVPFRPHTPRQSPPTAGASANTSNSATTSEPSDTQLSSATSGSSAKSTTSQSAETRSASAAATTKAQSPEVKPTNAAMFPEAASP